MEAMVLLSRRGSADHRRITHRYDQGSFKSRYDKGAKQFTSSPYDQARVYDFHDALVNAEWYRLILWKRKYFEGCMPIEVMAKRGIKTMLYVDRFSQLV